MDNKAEDKIIEEKVEKKKEQATELTPRRAAREIAFTIVYSRAFDISSTGGILGEMLDPAITAGLSKENPAFGLALPDSEKDYIRRICEGVEVIEPEFREAIGKYSTNWKLGRVSRVCGAILRVAVFEMRYMDDIDESVSINEAVELAKKYDTEDGAAFVNGVLGAMSRASEGAEK